MNGSGIHRVGAVVAGLIGVIVIMQPGTGVFHWAAMLILVSALCFALFQIATRRLVGAAPTMVTLYYTGIGGLLWTSLMVGFFWSPIGFEELAIFVALGSLGIAAHICVIKAFRRGTGLPPGAIQLCQTPLGDRPRLRPFR